VAVVLVLLFHAQLLGANGGFVGVDVFFVISGFLITGLLLRERASTGTISLKTFYARRVRRLLPASAVVLAVTMVAAVIVAPPLLVPAIGHDVSMAALYVSNIGFAAGATDYFAAGSAQSPILHFWSLGVEEQFYLVWPMLVLLATAGAVAPIRRVGVVVVAIAALSFGFAVWLGGVSQPWAFFSLPSRAWELALGGILAVADWRLGRVPRAAAAAAGWIGLLLIGYAAFGLDSSSAFPGAAALLPTAGAALIITAGAQETSWGPSWLLATRVPRFLGRISYSVYLWHWPMLIIPALATGDVLPDGVRLGLALATIPLAAATTALVEDPLRHGRIVGTRPRFNLAAGAAVALVIAITSTAVGAGIQQSLDGNGTAADGASAEPTDNAQNLDSLLGSLESDEPADSGLAASPSATTAPSAAASGSAAPSATPSAAPAPLVVTEPARQPAKDGAVPAGLNPSLGGAADDMPLTFVDRCHTQMDLPPSTAPCLYGNLSSKTTIALFGDSHALSWFPAFNRLAQDKGWRLLSLTMSACSPADIPAWNAAWNRVMPNCPIWRKQAIAELVRMHPDIIVVAGSRGFGTVDNSGHVAAGDFRTRMWIQGMKRTLKQLVPASGRVIYLADLPLADVVPPVCLSAHMRSILACATPVDQAINYPWLNTELTTAASVGALFIDHERWVCPTSPCLPVLGNLLVLRDQGHLTATFADALWRKMEQAVMRAIAQPTTTLVW